MLALATLLTVLSAPEAVRYTLQLRLSSATGMFVAASRREIWTITATLLLCSCGLQDNQKLMQEARENCLLIVKPYLGKIYEDRKFSFKNPLNASDDPSINTFEFIWDDSTISANPPISGLWITCRGDANSREILLLKVSGGDIITSPRKY